MMEDKKLGGFSVIEQPVSPEKTFDLGAFTAVANRAQQAEEHQLGNCSRTLHLGLSNTGFFHHDLCKF